eukprot:14980136-Ditylum_brightwellii.AAC.1
MEPTEQEPGNIKTNLVFASVDEIDGRIYSDQTGAFPKVSKRGNRYAMVFYVYDANHIQGIPIKNQSAAEFQCVYNFFMRNSPEKVTSLNFIRWTMKRPKSSSTGLNTNKIQK